MISVIIRDKQGAVRGTLRMLKTVLIPQTMLGNQSRFLKVPKTRKVSRVV